MQFSIQQQLQSIHAIFHTAATTILDKIVKIEIRLSRFPTILNPGKLPSMHRVPHQCNWKEEGGERGRQK